ncbi:glycosyltransferase [Paenibacillus sp. FSL H7-0350]|uniref:glycosyltransferase n=1 Tax=Paenibacillus sp. FSL H7-0350 TaxID=2975345 RepID=UPI0031582DF2
MNKIKILHVIGTLKVGGAETVAMNYFRFINRNIFNCDYLVYGDEIGEYEEEVYKLGGNVIRIPKPSDNYNEFQINCQNIFKKGGYDIVHSHTLLNNGLVMKAAKKAGVKARICHSHNIKNRPKENLITFLYAQYMKILIRKNSTDFLACAREAGIYLFGRKKFESKGIVIKNGIETSKFLYDSNIRGKTRENLSIENKFVVGNIGRLVDQKNQKYLLEIFQMVLKEIPDSILLIVGDGALRGCLEEKSKSLGIGSAVRFLGSRDDIKDLLQAMDVFVFPSLFEGLGIVLVEAQTSGLKCIVSNTIPREAGISNLIEFVDLNQRKEYWANLIISKKNEMERSNMEGIISKSGYDIKSVVKKLERIYIDSLGINMGDVS